MERKWERCCKAANADKGGPHGSALVPLQQCGPDCKGESPVSVTEPFRAPGSTGSVGEAVHCTHTVALLVPPAPMDSAAAPLPGSPLQAPSTSTRTHDFWHIPLLEAIWQFIWYGTWQQFSIQHEILSKTILLTLGLRRC